MSSYHYLRFSPLSESELYQSVLSSSNSSSCPDGVQWIWTVLGDCAVSTRQQISAYAGVLSILTWIMVGIPQIIKNCRNIDGMAGISFLLLFQWTAGDSTNLTGAILTSQLKPQIYLAVYFVMSDVVLLIQYLFYHIRTVRRKKEESRVIVTASRAVLCVMGLMSFTHCLNGFLTSSSFGMETEMSANAPIGHTSRFLLSEDSRRGSLSFRSEADLSPEELVGLSSSQRASPTFWSNTKDIIGYTIGCISSVFYIGSRLAQFMKNYNNKSTEGLAILMFVLAVLGNVFYGAQILIQDLHKEFLLEHTPWVVGSLGVVFLDCALLWQFRHYSQRNRRLDEARQSLLEHEDWTINAGSSIQHHYVEPQQARGFTDSLY